MNAIKAIKIQNLLKIALTTLTVAAIVVFGATHNVKAAEKQGTKEEAVKMVGAAVAYLNKNGREKAFAEINNHKGQFTDGDLYVVVYHMSGKVLAHGANPKMIGKDVSELRDIDGKMFVKERLEMMSKPGAKGWQDYKFMNPTSRQIEQKTMYLERHDDMIIGCGVYKK